MVESCLTQKRTASYHSTSSELCDDPEIIDLYQNRKKPPPDPRPSDYSSCRKWLMFFTCFATCCLTSGVYYSTTSAKTLWRMYHVVPHPDPLQLPPADGEAFLGNLTASANSQSLPCAARTKFADYSKSKPVASVDASAGVTLASNIACSLSPVQQQEINPESFEIATSHVTAEHADGGHGPRGTIDEEIVMSLALKNYQTYDFYGAAFSGFLLDFLGPRLTQLGSQLLCGASFWLLARGRLNAGASLQGATATSLVTSAITVGNLFPGREPLMMSIIVGASELSLLILPFTVYVAKHCPNLTFSAIMYMFMTVSILGALAGIVLLPDRPIVSESEGEPSRDFESGTGVEKSKLAPITARRHVVLQPIVSTNRRATLMHLDRRPTPSVDPSHALPLLPTSQVTYSATACSKRSFDFEPPSNDSAMPGRKRQNESCGRFVGQPLLKQVLSSYFIVFAVAWSFSAFRVCTYLDMNESYLESLGDDGSMGTLFVWLLPTSAVFSALMGWIVSAIGARKSFLVHLIVATLLSGCTTVKVLQLQWVSIFLFTALNGFLWACPVALINKEFGVKNFGALYATISILAGLINMHIGNPIITTVMSYEDPDWTIVNLWQLVIGLVSIACWTPFAFSLKFCVHCPTNKSKAASVSSEVDVDPEGAKPLSLPECNRPSLGALTDSRCAARISFMGYTWNKLLLDKHRESAGRTPSVTGKSTV